MEKALKPFGFLLGIVLLITFLGFYPTYFGRFPYFEGSSWVIHFHVLTLLLWFGLLITQAMLIRSKRPALHRKIGKFSSLVAALIAMGFVLATHYGQTREKNVDLLMATLFDASLFFLYYGLAMFYRKKPAYHSRFMMLTILPFFDPSAGRLFSPGIGLTFILLSILALLLLERSHQKQYKPYLIGLTGFLILLGAIICCMVAFPAIPEIIWQAFWG